MNDEFYMRSALDEAKKAFELDEVPIGAVVVLNDRIIARGHNQTELLRDTTAHAEMIALTAAFNRLDAKYLPEATLYVTVEPCLMCCGALHWSKIGRVVFGARDEKNGFLKFAKGASIDTHFLHPKTILTYGILAEESATLMTDFFLRKRRKRD